MTEKIFNKIIDFVDKRIKEYLVDPLISKFNRTVRAEIVSIDAPNFRCVVKILDNTSNTTNVVIPEQLLFTGSTLTTGDDVMLTVENNSASRYVVSRKIQ